MIDFYNLLHSCLVKIVKAIHSWSHRTGENLRPSLLILDEAFDGLDKSSRVELASMLESFFDESPRALVTFPKALAVCLMFFDCHVNVLPVCLNAFQCFSCIVCVDFAYGTVHMSVSHVKGDDCASIRGFSATSKLCTVAWTRRWHRPQTLSRMVSYHLARCPAADGGWSFHVRHY